MAIQAAFPDRFVRDAEGDLTEEDSAPGRTSQFDRADRSELRWGINYSRPIGKQPPPRALLPRDAYFAGGQGRRPRPDAFGDPGRGRHGESYSRRRDGRRGAPATCRRRRSRRWLAGGGGGGGGGGGLWRRRRRPGRRRGGRAAGRFGGGGPPAGGRLQVAIYHTLYFTDRMLVRPGGPTLDLLNGAPATGTRCARYRNEIEGHAGHGPWPASGPALSADWKEATFVTGVVRIAHRQSRLLRRHHPQPAPVRQPRPAEAGGDQGAALAARGADQPLCQQHPR